MEYVYTLFDAVIDITNEMSPYLLLGFLIAGIMHAFIPNGWYSKYLSGGKFRSVVNAAIFGIPLPLCSCGVIPTAMSLKREGAGNGAVVSFLIATPQTGVDSIFATYSLMGLPFAIVRPVVALFTAILGGVFVESGETACRKAACEGESDTSEGDACHVDDGCHAGDGCCCGHEHTHGHRSFWDRCVEAFKFGFVEMMEDIGKWLIVGLLIAGLITAFVPDSFFSLFKDSTLMSMLLVLCISIPMYLCATGSIPIAVALMMKGLTPGAALVLLMAGPACNMASILVINKVLGRKVLVKYLAAITVGAVVSGVGIDYLLPREWFTANLISTDACCHEEAGWFAWTCTGVLILLLLNIVRMKLQHKETCGGSRGSRHSRSSRLSRSSSISSSSSPCGCGHDEHEEHDDDCCETCRYRVGGMNCNYCRANVEKVIRSVERVEEVSVDLQSGIATVTGDDLDDKAITDAVESIGFTAERM